MDDTGNHREHDKNNDYWEILLKPMFENHFDYVLDFGCGHGRNISNILKNSSCLRCDGVDISSENIKYTEKNLNKEIEDKNRYKLYVNNGIDIKIIDNDSYNFIVSTIVFQHICVYEIRYNLLKDIYRILKQDGIFSFQMGFGFGHKAAADYYDNIYDAEGTNSLYDVRVEKSEYIENDLKNIGYKNISF